jgi:CubicO group peptidase (beta-lactamase class C family)
MSRAADSGTIRAGSHLLAAIIRQTTTQTPLEFAQENLFKPLGMANMSWSSDPTGLNSGGWGFALTLPDLARFGYLYLQQGMWEGQAVLPAAWVEASTTAQIETGYMDYHYGYQWWVDPVGSYHARGYGGQYIFVVPEQNFVFTVVREYC